MRKLIFLNRFYAPDHSATSQILTDLVHRLELNDAELHVVTSRLSYDGGRVEEPFDEYANGIQIHRLWTSTFGRRNLLGRALDYLSFYASSFFRLMKLVRAGDIVVAKTDPPMISVIAAGVTRLKRARLVNWLQDIFPEVARALGLGFSNDFLFGAARSLRNWSLKKAEKNIVLGEVMAEHLRSEGIDVATIDIIPNWVVGGGLAPIDKATNPLVREWGLQDSFVVGYSGNLGLAHDHATIIAAVRALGDRKDIHFLFIGGGGGFDILRRVVEDEHLGNVSFHPYQPIERLSESLSTADVHLVTLEPALEGYIVPSKFYGVLAVNRPILYVGSASGEIGAQVTTHGLGDVVEIGNSTELVQLIEHLAGSAEACRQRADRVRAWQAANSAGERSVERWRRLLSGLLPEATESKQLARAEGKPQ
ncbi:MAG: glycosyltransferase family 4 protein [Pseudomonadota bacterium]